MPLRFVPFCPDFFTCAKIDIFLHLFCPQSAFFVTFVLILSVFVRQNNFFSAKKIVFSFDFGMLCDWLIIFVMF